MSAILDVNETKNIIEKLEFQKKTQQEYSDAIIRCLNQIANTYNGKCNGIMAANNERIVNDLKTVLNGQDSSITYLRDMIFRYEQVVDNNIEMLGGIQ